MGSNNASELIYWTIIAGILVLCFYGLVRLFHITDPKRRIQKWMGISVLSAFVLWMLFANELLPGSDWYYDSQFTKRTTGRSIKLTKAYSHESYVDAFLGDGFSIDVYKMDEKSSDYFLDPDPAFFSNFPYKNSGRRSGVRSWTNSPMNSDDSIVCRFVLGSEDVDQTQPLSKLDKAQLFVGQMIDIDEAYYAYRAEWNGSYVWYASFYVLSPKNGYFVEIHNKM